VISFPRLECWNDATKVATVAAAQNKKRILCRVSLALLAEKYGASENTPMQIIAEHRDAIQDAARKLIEADAFEDDGSILIRLRDL